MTMACEHKRSLPQRGCGTASARTDDGSAADGPIVGIDAWPRRMTQQGGDNGAAVHGICSYRAAAKPPDNWARTRPVGVGPRSGGTRR